MAITAAQVKELREKTGVGMMECKKALTEAEGDVEKAVELLRKKGAAVAAKRAGQAANEGTVKFVENDAILAVIELRCETDFVANGADFQGFAALVGQAVLASDAQTVEELFQVSIDGKVLSDSYQDLVAKITEKIEVKNFTRIAKGEGVALASYSHMGGKIGVAVKLTFEGSADQAILEATAKDLAMQVAAYSPLAISGSEIDPALIEKEREIGRELALQAGTKPEFIDRQVEGKIKKWLKEVALEDQMFLKDTKKPVSQVVSEAGAAAGASKIAIDSFIRYELGA